VLAIQTTLATPAAIWCFPFGQRCGALSMLSLVVQIVTPKKILKNLKESFGVLKESFGVLKDFPLQYDSNWIPLCFKENSFKM